jgi:hypothetical protein
MTEIRDLHDRSLMTETHSDKEIVICFEGEKNSGWVLRQNHNAY